VWERIERYLDETLGVAEPISHRWVGTVGYTDGSLPVVDQVDGVYVAGGYSGHGNVLAYLSGQQLADRIA
jgi:glycine/D-amino acid oxidase-like deaminating enzyme